MPVLTYRKSLKTWWTGEALIQSDKADHSPKVKTKGTALVPFDDDDHKVNVIWYNNHMTDGI